MSDFNPKLGTFKKGAVSCTIGLLRYLLVPYILIYVLISIVDGIDDPGSSSWTAVLEDIKSLLILIGPILIVLSFFHGYYPKGSYSRLGFALAFAPVLIFFAYTVIESGHIDAALAADDLEFDLTFVLIFIMAMIVLSALKNLGEMVDNRRLFKHFSSVRIGTRPPEPEILEDPIDHQVWHDFRLRYGLWYEGFKESRASLSKYIVWPVLIFMMFGAFLVKTGDTIPLDLNRNLQDAIDFIMLLAIPIIVLSFFKGFYPKGSVSRTTFWLLLVVLIVIWIWNYMLMGIATIEVADLATLTIDYRPIVLLVILAAVLWGVYAIVELVSYRRDWIRNHFRPVDEKEAAAYKKAEKERRKVERQKAKADKKAEKERKKEQET